MEKRNFGGNYSVYGRFNTVTSFGLDHLPPPPLVCSLSWVSLRTQSRRSPTTPSFWIVVEIPSSPCGSWGRWRN